MSQPASNFAPSTASGSGFPNEQERQEYEMRLMRELEARLAQQSAQMQANFNAAVAHAAAAQVAAQGGAAPARERAAAPRSSAKARSPDAFTGVVSTSSPDLADRWLAEMERYLSVTDAEEPKWVSVAATYLDKSAAKWFNARATRDALGENPSWAEFRVAFVQRFRPQVASRTARMELRQLRQTGSVAEYSDKFQSCLQMIDDMSTTDQVYAYIYGLTRELRVEVDRANPARLTDAIELAAKAELLLSGGRRDAPRPFWNRGGGNARRGFSSSARPATSGPAPMDLSALDGALEEDGWDSQDEFEVSPSRSATRRRAGESQDAAVERLAAALLCRMETSGGGRGGAPRRDHAGPSLSKDEFDRLSKEGKCFNCKQSGHLARNCPKGRSNRFPGKSSN